MTLKEATVQFLEYVEIEKNRSHLTVKNYAFYLNRFLEWAGARGVIRPDQVTQETIRSFRLWLNRLGKNEPLKKNTQNYHLIALRTFLKYLSKRDIASIAPEKIELAKSPARTVDFLEGEDLERLLSMPASEDSTAIIRRRDRAILELLFSTGLRVSELASLTRGQINFEKDEFTIRGKGDKYRIVFLSGRAKTALAAYLSARRDAISPLFIRHDRAREKNRSITDDRALFLTPRSIQRLVQHYAKAAGITKKITPHVMRHSFATDLLMNGADIRSVQSLLGHASITTTQIYTHITNSQLRDVHKAFHGTRRKK